MAPHGYIDESGTMDHQGVMSVALVIFEGANSAGRLHDHVMQTLNPNYFQLLKQLKKERKSPPSLHFADMTTEQKCLTARRLSEGRVAVITAHHRHEGNKSHGERFSIYAELVSLCITRALEEQKELNVFIAKQGGWQKYDQDFCARLRQLPEEFTKRGEFRKGAFELVSASKPGIQLADFYVGAVREKNMTDSATEVFDLIHKQVISQEYYVLEAIKSER